MNLFDTKMTALADAIKAKNSNAAAKLSIDGMITAVNEIEQGGSDIQFGYINADGQFQSLDLSGDTPVDSGEPIVVDAVSFNTGKESPDYGGGGGSMELYRCASVVQPKVPVGFFVNHSKVTEVAPPDGWEGEPSYIYMEDIEYVAYNKTATGAARLWIDKNDIPYINDDYPQLDVLGWDGNRWIMCAIYSITNTPSEANGVANSDCTNPDATMAEIAAANWNWGPMGGDTFSDKVTVLEELGAITGWSGYKCTYDAENGELTQDATLTTGLTCDGFSPRIGKVYSIDSKLQATLFNDTNGAGFYKCSVGASMPSKFVLSNAGNTEVNGEYIRKDDSFSGYNSGALGIWYKAGTSSSSSDHWALLIYPNKNSYSVIIAKGYIDNDKFQLQYQPYRIDKNFKTFEEALELMKDTSKWNIMTGSNGGVAPAPAVEYQSPGVTALEVVSAGTPEVIGKYIDIGVRNIEGAVIQKSWIKESGDYAIVIRNTPPTDANLIQGYLYGDNTAFYQQTNMYNQCPVNDLTAQSVADAIWNKGSGNGALPAPEVECLHIPATWKGYRLKQNSDGTWSKADVETDSLTVGGEEPQIGTIYNEDATVTISGAMGLE